MCRAIPLFFILAFFCSWAPSVWADHENIVIETFIEVGDPFPGQKSYHKIYWDRGRQEYRTGTTDIHYRGKTYKVKSKGDDFKFTRNEQGVTVSGKTATGLTLGIGPFINYSFAFSGGPNGARVKGCHDGYPSYRIYDNGKLIYYHRHNSTKVWKLFGKCDVRVNRSYTYPSLH